MWRFSNVDQNVDEWHAWKTIYDYDSGNLEISYYLNANTVHDFNFNYVFDSK